MQKHGVGKITRLSVGFPEGIYDQLKETADSQSRTISSIVVEACRLYCESGVKEDIITFLNSDEGREMFRDILRIERIRWFQSDEGKLFLKEWLNVAKR